MSATIKHKAGKSNEASVTLTANASGSTGSLWVIGPKQADCPYPKGAGRYIREATDVYRFVEHVNLGAAGTEPTGYTSESN